MMEEKRNRDVEGPLVALGILGLLALFFSGQFGFRFGRGSLYEAGIKPSRPAGKALPKIRPICNLRIDKHGITTRDITGEREIASIGRAIDLCRKMNAARVDLLCTGDAVSGAFDQLKDALLTAGFLVFTKQPGRDQFYQPATPPEKKP
jgi:hypothetical protein